MIRRHVKAILNEYKWMNEWLQNVQAKIAASDPYDAGLC